MPLFSREIEANGVKTDLHDHLTHELVPLYVKENGLDALSGYTDAIDDMVWTLEARRKEQTTFEGLQKMLAEFLACQAEFSLQTARKIGAENRRIGLTVQQRLDL